MHRFLHVCTHSVHLYTESTCVHDQSIIHTLLGKECKDQGAYFIVAFKVVLPREHSSYPGAWKPA